MEQSSDRNVTASGSVCTHGVVAERMVEQRNGQHIKMDSNNADTHGKPERRCISHRCSVMSAVAMLTD